MELSKTFEAIRANTKGSPFLAKVQQAKTPNSSYMRDIL